MKSKGLGDTIAKITEATGIDKLVKFVAGEDCGCDERKEEYEVLKKKTELDKLKEKFDLELIGLQKARNEATDKETKSRLDGLIAIAKNDDALGKKALAELDAAEAAKKVALKYGEALEAVKLMNAKIAAFIQSMSLKGYDIPKTTTSGGSDILNKFPSITTPYDPLSSLTVTTQDLIDTGFRFDPLSGLRPTAQDIRITVDTAGSGDKLSQAIAESIQIATRSGYSTTPAGFL